MSTRKVRWERALVSLLLLLAMAACGSDDSMTPTEFVERQNELRACTVDDVCVVPRVPSCACAHLLPERNLEELTELGLRVDCMGESILCAIDNRLPAECVDGRCVSVADP